MGRKEEGGEGGGGESAKENKSRPPDSLLHWPYHPGPSERQYWRIFRPPHEVMWTTPPAVTLCPVVSMLLLLTVGSSRRTNVVMCRAMCACDACCYDNTGNTCRRAGAHTHTHTTTYPQHTQHTTAHTHTHTHTPYPQHLTLHTTHTHHTTHTRNTSAKPRAETTHNTTNTC